MAGATPLGNMVIKLGLDDADFGRGVANSKKQVSYLAKEMSANMKIADMAGNQLGKLGTKYDSLSKIIGAQENQVKDLKKAYEDSFVDGKATEQTKRLATQLQDANGKLANYKLQLQQTAGAMAEYKIRNEGFTGAVNKASDTLIKSGSALKDFGGKMSSVGSTMTKAVTLPIVAGFGYATKAASDFTTQIGEIGPLLTNGGEMTEEYRKQLDRMSDSSKQWSKTYGVATSEINNGLAEVVRKGYDANQTMGVMPSILDATKASGEQFNDVMNVTTEVISQFNLKGKTYEETLKNATRVTDGLTYVANATSAGFVDLGSAMSFVGPVANSLGMSVEETASAVGLLSDAGIGGEKAGTALRGALTRLLKPSKQNIEGFDKLGISVDDFKNGSLTLPDILDKIKKNTNGWTDAQRTAAIALAFGTESQSAMNVLVGQGGQALRDLTNDTKGATGATKDIAKAMNDLPANKVARFKESLNVLAITLGEKLLPIVTPWIEKATDMVNSFSELDEATKKNIVKWGLMAAAAGPALKLLGGGVSIVGGLATTTGKLGKSFVELSAEMAKKKAIEEVGQAFLAGNISAGDLMGTLTTGTATVTKFGGAAATASGSTGIGAMAAAIGPLGPAILGVVGVGGALAVGYGAWKLFGEEAYNSAQRTKQWGVDVGKVTGETLGQVKNDFGSATGQFGLMTEGLNANTDAMAGNFEQIGLTIEESLIKKIKGLDELIKNLPATTNQAMSDLLNEEKANAEKSLKIVQDNTSRISQIRAEASKENRELNASESKIIMDLSIGTTKAYVDTLDVSAAEKKKILSAMTGDVENASKKEAKLWLQSLGEQRLAQSQHAAKSRKEQEKFLEDMGYNLKGEFAQNYLKAWDEISKTTTDGFDSQMNTILAKYPELQNEVALANGTLIDSNDAMGQAMIAQNEYIIENAKNLSASLATNARKNADAIKWTADDMTTAGRIWNDLKLVDKEGNVKTNAAEIVTEATKETAKWNEIRMVLHDADLDSNAKKVVGEAAIANGWWDGMAWEDKEAVLQDEVTTNMYKALEANGTWDQMTFDEKKAILYSNTPEKMTETIASLGLWDEYLPEIKELDAKNEVLMSKLSKSKDSMRGWNNLHPVEKELLLDNLPLMDKVFESTESMNAWNELDPVVKNLLANGEDLNAKLLDGTIRQDIYSKNIPAVKKLLGDATSISNAALVGGKELDTYSRNNPKNKNLLGSSKVIQTEASMGAKMLSAYENNNPQQKFLKGDSSNVRNNAASGVNALNNFDSTNPGTTFLRADASSAQSNSSRAIGAVNGYDRTNPGTTFLRATDNASYNAGRATDAVKNFGRQGNKTVTLTSITKNITQWITEKFTKNATGTNYHPGGLAMVNDQRGAMYRELVQHPTGEMYIPQGRNVMLDLPRGSKVYTAAQTKQMVPKYAEGVGIPKNSTLVRNLESVNSRNIESTTVIKEKDYDGKLNQLIAVMESFGQDLKNLKLETVIDAKSFNRENAPYQSSRSMKRTKYQERGLAIDVQL